MFDFLLISTRKNSRKGVIEIYPKFVIKKSFDLMIRGGDFYAVWIEDIGFWSTEEQDALELIDKELDKFAEEYRRKYEDRETVVLHMWDSSSGMIDSWHKYCQKQMRDSFHMLDEKIIFANDTAKKRDYASKKLTYPLEKGEAKSYNRLMSVLYSPEERHKIEWAIGSVVTGDSKKIQKFVVLYGSAGTGKSTVLNIIQKLFEGYYSVFDAKALGSSSSSFALEAFKLNPLVAIQHDGDLSKIEDNTRLNSLVSHEIMTVNEKFKSIYSTRFKSFLFMGTNKPVKITDAKSGLLRRLIDVSPSGERVDTSEYHSIMNQIDFELPAIAYHCREVYLSDPTKYDDYIPTIMLGASNDFYNFVMDSYLIFKQDNGSTMKAAWEMYKTYCDEAKVAYALPQRAFKEELKNYFKEYKERFTLDDGTRVRNYYHIFRTDKFDNDIIDVKPKELAYSINFRDADTSIFDKVYLDAPAQYANKYEVPKKPWEEISTKLADITPTALHYVMLPSNHIVIDFDIKDSDGNKSLEKNIKEANKWPHTYSELSKSGQGIHLHYIYTGDISLLARTMENNEDIEIKTFVGNASLRRKLTKCNDLEIATISSGLPLKGEKKVISESTIKSERGLRNLITRNLNKEIHPATKPSIDFIYKILEDSYNNGLHYDISDMRNAILGFAASSTNNAEYCIKVVSKMHFKSETASDSVAYKENEKIVFFDVEVFPNLFLVNWKVAGDSPIIRMINPTSSEIEEILGFRLIGFNCRRYDNHILYGRLLGYTLEELFKLSTRIIAKSTNAFFAEAYNISYTDVYDFSSVKQSLKKFEIDLGITHKELGLRWDEPVPESKWEAVAEYCDNDVIATEAVFNARHSDFLARKILADIAGMTVNDTTNTLTTRIIFGRNRSPQGVFKYRNLSLPVTI